VEGLRRIDARKGYVVNDGTHHELAWFRRQTDRMAMFLDEATKPGDWCNRVLLYRAYERWCGDNRRGPALARRAFYAELAQRGYTPGGRHGDRGFKALVLVDNWDDFDDD
jgi:hypothetical protein